MKLIILFVGSDIVNVSNIRPSNLSRAGKGMVLDRLSITGGKFVNFGISVLLGNQHIPPRISSDNYFLAVEKLHHQPVVFWDENTKQAWLTNGTSALLHMVRFDLKTMGQGVLRTRLLYQTDELAEQHKHCCGSAAGILLDDNNLLLPILPGKLKTTYSTAQEKFDQGDPKKSSKNTVERTAFNFVDLVEAHLNILEQVAYYQKERAGADGIKIKVHTRRHLEGWDFTQLVHRDATPQYAVLNESGYGWVDFIRSIGAITLMARDLGPLIQLKDFNGVCQKWQHLPRDRFLLAGCVSDVEMFTNNTAVHTSGSKEPVEGLMWHSPRGLSAKCKCHSSSGSRAACNKPNPVQEFYPSKLRKARFLKKGKTLSLTEVTGGAVIFGHDIHWGFKWRSTDDAEEEQSENHSNDAVTGSSTDIDATDISLPSTEPSDGFLSSISDHLAYPGLAPPSTTATSLSINEEDDITKEPGDSPDINMVSGSSLIDAIDRQRDLNATLESTTAGASRLKIDPEPDASGGSSKRIRSSFMSKPVNMSLRGSRKKHKENSST
jgi:hypothetical protein